MIMLTGIRFIKFFLALLLPVYALQAQTQDTTNFKPFERYWTKPRIVPKIGAGAQEIAFAEIGIHLHQIYVHPLTLASAGPYFTTDILIKDKDPIIGPKLGYEVTAGLFGFAADFTYYTDFDRESVMFTPKAGLSILGFANLFYGYNIVLSDDEFSHISRNRFSLVFNLNKDYFNLRSANKKPEKTEK